MFLFRNLDLKNVGLQEKQVEINHHHFYLFKVLLIYVLYYAYCMQEQLFCEQTGICKTILCISPKKFIYDFYNNK